jgi:nucleotide-binding universal stress UspA family protein
VFPLHGPGRDDGWRREQREPPFLLQAEAMGERHVQDGSVGHGRVNGSRTCVTCGEKHRTDIRREASCYPRPRRFGGPPFAVNVAQESADQTKADLQRKVEDLKLDGVTAEFALPEMTTHGVAHAISEFARDVGADLIVVGTQGSSWLVRVLVGGVTRRLLELAPCPVLAVPPEDEDIASRPKMVED